VFEMAANVDGGFPVIPFCFQPAKPRWRCEGCIGCRCVSVESVGKCEEKAWGGAALMIYRDLSWEEKTLG
jgi:hypothetical protein